VATRRPSSLEELGTISGVGATKLERYGPSLLAALTGAEVPADETDPLDV